MKLGLVVDGGHWSFVNELYADWQTRYQTRVFAFREIHPPFFYGRINTVRQNRALGHFLAENDVVFFEWAGPLLARASRMPHQARLVVRLHSYELFEYAPQVNWSGVDRVILVSKAMQRHFCEAFPAAADRMVVINNGVALDRFTTPERTSGGVIGMLGNLIPIKRVYEVILAVYALKQAGYPFVLRLGGLPDTGADAERYSLAMRRLVRELGLESHVCFVGKVTDAPAFLGGVDIFISNSYWEGQQVALLEAMASGCYCLSHFWDGADEVLPPEHLFVTDQELRDRLASYGVLAPDARKQIRARMRALACERFDLEKTRSRIREVIQDGKKARADG